MFWILYDLVFMLLPGKMSLNYYMCTGEDPDKDFYRYKKVLIVIRAYLKHHDLINDLSTIQSTFLLLYLQFPINAILPVITALTYVGFSAKISYHRRKLAAIGKV